MGKSTLGVEMDKIQREAAADSLWDEVEKAPSVNTLMKDVAKAVTAKKAKIVVQSKAQRKQDKLAKKQPKIALVRVPPKVDSVKEAKEAKEVPVVESPVKLAEEVDEARTQEVPLNLSPPVEPEIKPYANLKEAYDQLQSLIERIEAVDPAKIGAVGIKDLMAHYARCVALVNDVKDQADKDWLTGQLNQANDRITEIRNLAGPRLRRFSKLRFLGTQVKSNISDSARRAARYLKSKIPEDSEEQLAEATPVSSDSSPSGRGAALTVRPVIQAPAAAPVSAPTVVTAPQAPVVQVTQPVATAAPMVRPPEPRGREFPAVVKSFQEQASKKARAVGGMVKNVTNSVVMTPARKIGEFVAAALSRKSNVDKKKKGTEKDRDERKLVVPNAFKWLGKQLKSITGGLFRFLRRSPERVGDMASTLGEWMAKLAGFGAIGALFVKPLLEGVDKALTDVFGENYVTDFIKYLWDKGWTFLYDQVSGFFASLFKDTAAKKAQETASGYLADQASRFLGSGTGSASERKDETAAQTNVAIQKRLNLFKQYDEDARSTKDPERKKEALASKDSTRVDLQKWVDNSKDKSIAPMLAKSLESASVTVPAPKIGDVSLNQTNKTGPTSSSVTSVNPTTSSSSSSVETVVAPTGSTAREGRSSYPVGYTAPEVPTASPRSSVTVNEGNQTVTASPVAQPPMESSGVTAKPVPVSQSREVSDGGGQRSASYGGSTPGLSNIPTYASDAPLLFNSGILT
jgi:hypothetical protein